MPLIPYPNIPQLPGVPQLNRSPAFPPGPPPALGGAIALGRLALALLSKPVWGIFRDDPPVTTPSDDDGTPTVVVRGNPRPVIVPDSIREFSSKNEWQVSDYPVEQGGFASYNKVNNPFEVQLRLTKGGSLNDRKEFLKQIDAVAGDTRLYRIVTPEKVYPSVNITRVDNRRVEQNGAYFLSQVDIYFREIRFVAAEYTSTAANTANAIDPAALPPINTGAIQAVEVPPSVEISLLEGIP